MLLDSSFIAPGNVRKLCGKRRFTLAHECAHQILFQLETDEQKEACRKLYAERRAYSLRDLKSNEDWNEWQANALGAAILMPQQEIDLHLNNEFFFFAAFLHTLLVASHSNIDRRHGESRLG